MSAEITVLALAGLLQGAQFALVSIPANLELGPAKLASPRDPARLGTAIEAQVSPITGRLFRALNNHFEGLILFTLAVVVVTLADTSTLLTQVCAWAYLAARVAYIPAYAFGWSPWRSAIWFVSFTATMIMLVASLF
ncbi:MAG: MAPEG family protein [Pseudomonadota bacterium]